MPGLSIEEFTVQEAEKVLALGSDPLESHLDRWTPIHTPSHLALWERRLGAGHDCRIVVAWDSRGELAAYAPLMRAPGPFGPVRVPTLRFIGNNIGYPGDILYTEIFSASRERSAVQAVLQHVGAGWSLGKWELGYVPRASRTWRAAKALLGDGLVGPGPDAVLPFVSVTLPSEWDAYFALLTANTRSSYRRGLRHLDSQGTLKVVFDRTPDRVRARVAELIENHMRWLVGTDREGWYGDAAVKEFLVASAEFLAQRGEYLAATLELDGAPIAWIVGPTYGTVSFEHLSSYDRTYSEDSPGLVLGLELMRELVSRGVSRAELGPGSTLYKKRLGGVEWPYVRVLGYQGWARHVVTARGLTRRRPKETSPSPEPQARPDRGA